MWWQACWGSECGRFSRGEAWSQSTRNFFLVTGYILADSVLKRRLLFWEVAIQRVLAFFCLVRVIVKMSRCLTVKSVIFQRRQPLSTGRSNCLCCNSFGCSGILTSKLSHHSRLSYNCGHTRVLSFHYLVSQFFIPLFPKVVPEAPRKRFNVAAVMRTAANRAIRASTALSQWQHSSIGVSLAWLEV